MFFPFDMKRFGGMGSGKRIQLTRDGPQRLAKLIEDWPQFNMSIIRGPTCADAGSDICAVLRSYQDWPGVAKEGGHVSLLYPFAVDRRVMYDTGLLSRLMIECDAYYGFTRPVPSESLAGPLNWDSAMTLSGDIFPLEFLGPGQKYMTFTPRANIRSIFFENVLGEGHLARLRLVAIPLPWETQRTVTVESKALMRIALTGPCRSPSADEQRVLLDVLAPIQPSAVLRPVGS